MRARLPLAVTFLVLASALFARAPLVDPVTGGPAPRAELVRPAGYVALSPLSSFLDVLAFMGKQQLIAFLATLLLLFALWRVLRARRGGRGGGWVRATGRETLAATLVLALLFALAAAGTVLHRPQARVSLTDRAELVVDFHSHTRGSHDGKPWFTAERNRAWHRALGFDAAYVTDHARVKPEVAARQDAGNPERAGEGMVLLRGVELRSPEEHPVLLGVTAADTVLFPEGELGERPGETIRAIRDRHAAPIPLILTLPGEVDPAYWPARPQAFEIIDPTPRGLAQLDRDRERLLHLSDSLDFALVAGTNNHGWYAPGVGWNVMRVPGWRSLSPANLDLRIRQALMTEGRSAVRVVARNRVGTPEWEPLLALTLPAVVWNQLAILSATERVVWLAWAWGLWLLAGALRRRRATRPPPTQRARDSRCGAGQNEPCMRVGGTGWRRERSGRSAPRWWGWGATTSDAAWTPPAPRAW